MFKQKSAISMLITLIILTSLIPVSPFNMAIAQGAPGEYTVDTLADPSSWPPTACVTTACSLRAAISAANANNTVPTKTIKFSGILATSCANPVPQWGACVTIYLNSELVISTKLIIQGIGKVNGKYSLAVSSANSGNPTKNRAFNINLSGDVTFQNLQIASVTHNGDGAAIFNSGKVTLDNSSLNLNTAFSSSSQQGHGGAIFNDTFASLTVKLSNIAGSGSAHDGGGIYSRGQLQISDTTFNGNSAFNNRAGGALYADYPAPIPTNPPFPRIIVQRSLFDANKAGFGGAIYSTGRGVSIGSSTFTYNVTSQYGGSAVYNTGRSDVSAVAQIAELHFNTFSYNGTRQGTESQWGTLYNSFVAGAPATMELVSNIITESKLVTLNAQGVDYAVAQGVNCAGSNIVDGPNNNGGKNIEWNGTDHSCDNMTYNAAKGHIPNVNPQLPSNPQMCPTASTSVSQINPLCYGLDNNSGPTKTIRLYVGSPAVDTGDGTDCAVTPTSALDQRSIIRPQLNQCDVGAYELTPLTIGSSLIYMGRGTSTVPWIYKVGTSALNQPSQVQDLNQSQSIPVPDLVFSGGFAPAASPDGRTVAFKDGRPVKLMNANGSNIRTLTDDAVTDTNVSYSAPQWASNNRTIVFIRTTATVTPVRNDLYSIDSVTKTKVQLTPTFAKLSADTSFSISPDGNWVAFSAPTNPSDPNPSPSANDLYIVNVNGTGLLRLTTNITGFVDASWSPDGQKLVFSAGNTGPTKVYTINRDGTNLQVISDATIQSYNPSWSPDGTLIAYVQCGSTTSCASHRVYLMTPSGANKRPLIPISPDFPYSSFLETWNDAAWSADSHWLTYYVEYPYQTGNPLDPISAHEDIHITSIYGETYRMTVDNETLYTGWLRSAAASYPETVGAFRASNTVFYFRNTNTSGPANSQITFGASTYLPIVGDWNGDGIDTPGVYNSITGEFFLTNKKGGEIATVDYSLVLGNTGDTPLVGDWNGDGFDTVGVFRPSNGLIYLRNTLTTGYADYTMVLGNPGDVGIAGDWNGDGVDSPGVFRPSTTGFYLTNQICNCAIASDYFIVFGASTDIPFAGDWNGDGVTGVGLFRSSNAMTYLRNDPTTSGGVDISLSFSITGDKPLAGTWLATAPILSIPPTATPTEPEIAPTFVPKR